MLATWRARRSSRAMSILLRLGGQSCRFAGILHTCDRHDMGEVAAVEFISYEATLEKFQQEWLEIVKCEQVCVRCRHCAS